MIIKDLYDKLHKLQENSAAIKIQQWWLSVPICIRCNLKVNMLYSDLCDICFYDKYMYN